MAANWQILKMASAMKIKTMAARKRRHSFAIPGGGKTFGGSAAL